MPAEIEDEAGEMNDLPVENQDEADASNEAEQSAAAAESSAAEDASKPADTLSVVRDVVGAKQGDEAAASSANGEEEDHGSENQDADEQDNENYSDVPFNKHPRFQQLLGDLKTAKADAERYRNVEQFIEGQNLTGEEAAEVLTIGGLIKTNPVEAWKRMLPTIQKLAVAAGEILPDDLKQKVEAGEITRDLALETSRARARNESVERFRTFDQQRQETRQEAERRTAIVDAAGTWERERRLRDPNFAAKEQALMKEVAWLQARDGKPTTPEGVRKQLDEAYKAVKLPATPADAVRPAKKAVQPVTGGQVNGSVRPEIKSTMDAVKAVVDRRASA